MTTGEVNSSFFNKGCLRISSSFAYRDFRSVEGSSVVGAAQEANNAEADRLPTRASEMNLRLVFFIMFHINDRILFDETPLLLCNKTVKGMTKYL